MRYHVISVSYFFRVPVSDFRIRAGSANSASGGQLTLVSQVIQHENYTDGRYDNDVALLILDNPLTLDISVDVIKLPVQDLTVLDGTDAEVSGWGLLAVSTQLVDLFYRFDDYYNFYL